MSAMKDRIIIITNQNGKKENKWQNKNCLKDFWDNNKHSNTCIKVVPKMRRENGVNTIFDEKKLNNIFEKCIFDKIIAEQWSTWRMKQISKYRKDRGSKKIWIQNYKTYHN